MCEFSESLAAVTSPRYWEYGGDQDKDVLDLMDFASHGSSLHTLNVE